MTELAGCTIIARNYLSYARVLAASFKQYYPDSRFYLLVVDGLTGDTSVGDNVHVVDSASLGMADYYELAFKYSVTELATAVKPNLLRYILTDCAEAAVVFLDPDMLLFRRLIEVEEALQQASIVLTPHLLDPIPADNCRPSEQDILIAGAYNLGFIAVRSSDEVRHLLDWWEAHLEDDCRVDPARGLFVDQRWIDLVPGLFPSSHILRDPTYNVAYWNVHTRTIDRLGTSFSIAGRPLSLFHFSGFDAKHPGVLSRHQNRTVVKHRSPLWHLLQEYAGRQLAAGYREFSQLPYGFAQTDSGIQVDDPRQPVRAEAPRGVNVCGYLRDESGLGTIARGYIGALQLSGIPLALRDLGALSPNRSLDPTIERVDKEFPYSVNLVCVNADQLFVMLNQTGEGFFLDAYTIGVWFWELPQFPDIWSDRFAYYDEIWAASSFIATALTPIAPIPVVRMPPALASGSSGSRVAGRARLKVADDEFVFLFVFDFRSHAARKNPRGVIDAFNRAFPTPDGVRLIIKCVNGNVDTAALAGLRARSQSRPIDIVDEYWSAEAMRDLNAACDAYISLHRSEGLGLTMAEAMLAGKPVIATGWSGNMDFMNAANSYPVRYELRELTESVGPYARGQHWAEPSIEHAAELMREVVHDRDAATAHGELARLELTERFSVAAVARAVQQRMAEIERMPRSHRSSRAQRAASTSAASVSASSSAILHQAPTVPPMDLDHSVYGWPGVLVKRGMDFLLSYHRLYQQQLNFRFAGFMRDLAARQGQDQRELQQLSARVAVLESALRDAEQSVEHDAERNR